MRSWWQRTKGALRVAFVGVAIAGLAACGGGGDDGAGDTDQPPPGVGSSPFQGAWQLAVSAEGEMSGFVNVPVEAVPTAQEVEALSVADAAQMFGSAGFEGYTVTLNGATITVRGPGTNLVMTVTGIRAANYQGCGTCAIGTRVSFDLTMTFTQSGTVDGHAVPSGSQSATVRFVYRRAS